MFSLTKRIFTILFLALLLFLFTVPSLYLGRLTADMEAAADAAKTAVQTGTDPAPHLSRMANLIDGSAETLRLFLDHDTVDEVLTVVHACVPLREEEALLSAIATAESALLHMRAIERFDIHTLF